LIAALAGVAALGWAPSASAQTNYPGIALSQSSMVLNEGQTKSYTVVLNSQPANNVTVTMQWKDYVGGYHNNTYFALDVTPRTLEFSTGNWNRAQTVQVHARVNIGRTDLPSHTIQLKHRLSSGGEGYDGGALPVEVRDSFMHNLRVLSANTEYQRFATVVEGESLTFRVERLHGKQSGSYDERMHVYLGRREGSASQLSDDFSIRTGAVPLPLQSCRLQPGHTVLKLAKQWREANTTIIDHAVLKHNEAAFTYTLDTKVDSGVSLDAFQVYFMYADHPCMFWPFGMSILVVDKDMNVSATPTGSQSNGDGTIAVSWAQDPSHRQYTVQLFDLNNRLLRDKMATVENAETHTFSGLASGDYHVAVAHWSKPNSQYEPIPAAVRVAVTVPLVLGAEPETEPEPKVEVVEVVTQEAQTAKPRLTDVTVGERTHESIAISWPEVAGAESYQVRYWMEGKKSKTAKKLTATAASATLENLKANRRYVIRVGYVIDGALVSGKVSEPVKAKTHKAP